jgi:hypothetical protein
MRKKPLLFATALLSVSGVVYWAQKTAFSPSIGIIQRAEQKTARTVATPKTEAFPNAADISRIVAEARESVGVQEAQFDGAFELILDPDPNRRVEGVRALGSAHLNKLLPLFLALLQGDVNPGVRAESASALENFESVPAASLSLVAALNDTDPGVRENALLSLRMHRNDRVQSALQAQLKKGVYEESTHQAVAVFLSRYYPHLDPFDDLLKRASSP